LKNDLAGCKLQMNDASEGEYLYIYGAIDNLVSQFDAKD
jgi:hypothetical protein